MVIQKKSVLFITPSLKSGGGIRVIIQIANYLSERGYDVRIMHPNNSDERNNYYVCDTIKIISIGDFKPSMRHKLRNLFLLIRTVNRHYSSEKWIIVYSDAFTAILAPLLKRFKQWRYMQGDDYHMFDDLRLFRHKWILYLYKFFEYISYKYSFVNYMFNSGGTYKQYINISHRYNTKPAIVCPSVEHAVFNKTESRDDCKTRIMTVGRKHGIKGFQYFIDAISMLKELIKIDEVIVVSQDDLSEFDTSNMSIVRPNNDSDINRCYNRANIFVCTSESEGFGLPILEAMATGCCVVTTRTEGIVFCKDEQNSLIVEPKNPQKIAYAIKRLCDDRGLMKKLGDEGYKTSFNYSTEKNGEKFLSIIMDY